jgi:hypothetical protein
LLEGIARDEDGKAIMEGDGWIVIVDSKAPWPKGTLGKHVETLGMYNPGKPDFDNPRAVKRYSLIDGTWRPVKLEDQLGQKVELRGTGMHHNGVFAFRGIDVYVENLENLPGWSNENVGQPIVIRGVLDKAKLPRIDQISVKANRNLREHYIIRKASWAPTDPLLAPERSAALRWIATNSIDDKDE